MLLRKSAAYRAVGRVGKARDWFTAPCRAGVTKPAIGEPEHSPRATALTAIRTAVRAGELDEVIAAACAAIRAARGLD